MSPRYGTCVKDKKCAFIFISFYTDNTQKLLFRCPEYEVLSTFLLFVASGRNRCKFAIHGSVAPFPDILSGNFYLRKSAKNFYLPPIVTNSFCVLQPILGKPQLYKSQFFVFTLSQLSHKTLYRGLIRRAVVDWNAVVQFLYNVRSWQIPP